MYEHHIRYFDVQSAALSGNPMGNPDRRLLTVLLPEDFTDATRYPTIWMLDGYLGSGRTQLNHPGAVGTPFGDEMLRWQRERLLPPVIFVFPDPSTLLGGSQYIDSVSCGPFMRHITEELVPFVDANLPTIATKSARVLAGHSSGGFGALALAMLRPGVFGSAVVSAADSAFELSQRSSFGRVCLALARHDGVEAFLAGALAAQARGLSEDDEVLLEVLAMGSCYSPAPHLPGWCELPFDPSTGELRPDVWARWQEWDPVVLAGTHTAALAELDHLHLDCGDDDRYFAHLGHRRISAILERAGVPHLLTEFPGGHDGTRYRYQFRFEQLGRVLARVL